MHEMLALLAAIALTQTSPPASLSGHAGAMVGDRVYVSGGMDDRANHQFVGAMWEVDLKTGTWTQRSEMKTPRAMAAAAALGNSIYVAGGFRQSGEYLRSVERFDILTRRWVAVAPMRFARTRFVLANVKGRLYAIGGLTGRSDKSGVLNVDSVEEYDPKANRWNDAGRLQLGRHGFAACVDGGLVYILGGYAGSSSDLTSTCEVYDPAKRLARPIPSLPTARGFHAAVVLNGSIVCFGGRPPAQHPCRYDALGKRWIELPTGDVDLNRFLALARGSQVITVGGESSQARPILLTHRF